MMSNVKCTTHLRTNGAKAITSQRLFLSLMIGFSFGFVIGYFFMMLGDGRTNLGSYKEAQRWQTSDLTTKPHHRLANRTLAQKLNDEVRVLCWVLTAPQYHDERAKHVKLTWGRRCTQLIFMSSEEDIELGTIALNVTEGRESLWQKTRQAFEYIYDNHLHDFDWFLKADDDTYIIMENLRYMLREHSSDSPIYFGSKFQYQNAIYMSGGAGYVLSREAVRRLVEVALDNQTLCNRNGYVEDLELGVCLAAVDVIAGDSRDEQTKSRFHPFSLSYHLKPEFSGDCEWIRNYSYYDLKLGFDSVSRQAISFHYLEPIEMYEYEYLIYHVKVMGMWSMADEASPRVQLTQNEELKLLARSEIDHNA